ncbi:MAG: GXWXG domain-containing protein [Solirubrobacteraceae bacterium]
MSFNHLHNYFISLPIVEVKEMHGEWKGGFFKSGKLLDITLTNL